MVTVPFAFVPISFLPVVGVEAKPSFEIVTNSLFMIFLPGSEADVIEIKIY